MVDGGRLTVDGGGKTSIQTDALIDPQPSTVQPQPFNLGALQDELADTLDGDRGGARDLIAALLEKPRFWPTAHRDEHVADELVGSARAAAASIRKGMPFEYAIGRATFRHLSLRVDRRVLIPRPETEVLVDLALEATGGRGTIADVCTGSGAIALAFAAEGNFERVFATDLSSDALDLARENLVSVPEEKRAAVEFREGDLCAPLAGLRLEALVSNPPYIANPERAELPPSVRDWEPPMALFSGDDGMDAIRRLVSGAADLLVPGGALIVEIDSRRAEEARASATGPSWESPMIRRDLTGRDRFLVARRSRH